MVAITGFIDRGKGKALSGMQLYSVQTGIVAHPGGGQGSAVPLTAQNCFILTVGTAGDSVLLPVARAGAEITVINQSATATGPNVFANGTDTINGGAPSGSVAVAASSVLIFYAATDGAWWSK